MVPDNMPDICTKCDISVCCFALKRCGHACYGFRGIVLADMPKMGACSPITKCQNMCLLTPVLCYLRIAGIQILAWLDEVYMNNNSLYERDTGSQ